MDLPPANHGSIEEGCRHASSPSEAAARFDGPVTFSVHYDLVPFDYWAAQLFAHREATARRTSPVRRFFVGLVYLAVAVGSVWLVRRWGISLLVVYLSLAALLCGWLWWTLPRRTTPLAAELLGHRELVVSPVGITVTGESRTASWAWQAIQRTTISETHLLIFDQQTLLCLVPKRAFVDTEQFCRFSAELDRRIIAASGHDSSVSAPTTPFATVTGEQDSATARTPVLTWAERLRSERLPAEAHLKQSTLLLAGLLCMMSAVLFIVPEGLGTTQPTRLDAAALVVVKAVLIFAAAMSCVLAWGVRRLAAWTRRPLIILSLLSLLLFPLGTIVGLQILRRLGGTAPPRLLSREYEWIFAQTRHLRQLKTAGRTGVLTWIAVALIALIVILVIVIAQLPPEFRQVK